MNRITILIVAAVVAVGSCFGLVKYASGAENRAVEASKPVQVLVAQKDVPAGTAFSTAWNDHRIAFAQTLQSLVPPTAVTDPTALQGMVVTAALVQGQYVVRGAFADPATVGRVGPPTFANQLPNGTVAVSFKAEAASAVSDLVRPGDHVNLLVQVPNASVLGLPDSGGAAVVHIFQDLEIIAIGDVTAPPPDATEAPKNPGTGLYTVAVAPEDSARLLLLSNEYDVFVTLVGPKTQPSDIPPIADRESVPPLDAAQPPVTAAAGTP
ncbi:MAG TPA: Flp pilus assembly protein CpaB [Acidimicrobiales bacterium]|jgi:Flp pilus assembly protein CpaB